MKKIYIILSCLFLLLNMYGCSNSKKEIAEKENESNEITVIEKKSEYQDLIEEINKVSYRLMEEKNISFTHTEISSTHISFRPDTNGLSSFMGLRTVKGEINIQDKTGRFEEYLYPDLIWFSTDEGDTVDKFNQLDISSGTLEKVYKLENKTIKVENGTVPCEQCNASFDSGNGEKVTSEYTLEEAAENNLNTSYFNYIYQLSGWITLGTYDENVKIEKKENEIGIQYIITSTSENVESSPEGGRNFMNEDHEYTENLKNVIQLDKKNRIISCRVEYPWTCKDNNLSVPNLNFFTIQYND